MSERQENMGRYVELRRERGRIAVKCEALRSHLRRALPVAEEIQTLDSEDILNTALALNQGLLELTSLDKKLDVLNRELGE